MGGFDFGRGAFNVAQHYSSVFMQQGRVQLDADSSEDSEANSEKIRRLTGDSALRDDVAPLTPADPAPTGDGTTSTKPSSLDGFEPAGGLHPIANEPGVALFGGILQHLHENPRSSGWPGFFTGDSGASALSKGLPSASAD